MKPWILPLVLFSSITSAAAQSRVYTNADLNKPLVRTRTPTAEEMQGLLDRQFIPPAKAEPKAIVLPIDPAWPFTYARRLEPDPWRTPAGLYGAWPFYGGYTFNPYVVYPPPAHAACYGFDSDNRSGETLPGGLTSWAREPVARDSRRRPPDGSPANTLSFYRSAS